MKKSPKVWPNTFLSKLTHNLNREWPLLWATSVILRKLAKENNHPLGENSPNLFTLLSVSRMWARLDDAGLIIFIDKPIFQLACDVNNIFAHLFTTLVKQPRQRRAYMTIMFLEKEAY
jgi:hypothetical protein